MKKKVLFVASTADHLLNFHIPYIESLKKSCEVFTMAKEENGNFVDFNINFEKKIMSFNNMKIVKKIKNILLEHQFDLVVLNTTLAAFFVRLAMKGLKKRPKVVNIVHGYLFSEQTNCIKRNFLLSAEKIVKKQTDAIIVMNDEDYDIAVSKKLCVGKVYKINGMGIDRKRFKHVIDKDNGCFEEITFSFIGELSSRKNQLFLIKFIKELEKYDIYANLNLIGEGGYRNKVLKAIKKEKLEERVKLIGYDNDIEKYLYNSNYYVCASKIEGLPFNILEAMYVGSVIFSSDTKGTVDLIKDLENGVLFKHNNIEDFVAKFRLVKNNLTLQRAIRKNAVETAKKYLLDNVFEENMQILKSFIKD